MIKQCEMLSSGVERRAATPFVHIFLLVRRNVNSGMEESYAKTNHT